LLHLERPWNHAVTDPLLADPHATPMCGLHAAASAEESENPALAQGPRAAMESADLFKGRKTVEIRHNGAIYRLQATRLGKLILTK
jgi:hemin uptake protein HemP